MKEITTYQWLIESRALIKSFPDKYLALLLKMVSDEVSKRNGVKELVDTIIKEEDK